MPGTHPPGASAGFALHPLLCRMRKETRKTLMKPNPARSYRGLFWGLALAGLLLDQVSKYEVFKWLYPGSHVVRDFLGNERLENEHVIVPGVFKLHVAHGTVADQAGGLFTGLRTWSADV